MQFLVCSNLGKCGLSGLQVTISRVLSVWWPSGVAAVLATGLHRGEGPAATAPAAGLVEDGPSSMPGSRVGGWGAGVTGSGASKPQQAQHGHLLKPICWTGWRAPASVRPAPQQAQHGHLGAYLCQTTGCAQYPCNSSHVRRNPKSSRCDRKHPGIMRPNAAALMPCCATQPLLSPSLRAVGKPPLARAQRRFQAGRTRPGLLAVAAGGAPSPAPPPGGEYPMVRLVAVGHACVVCLSAATSCPACAS